MSCNTHFLLSVVKYWNLLFLFRQHRKEAFQDRKWWTLFYWLILGKKNEKNEVLISFSWMQTTNFLSLKSDFYSCWFDLAWFTLSFFLMWKNAQNPVISKSTEIRRRLNIGKSNYVTVSSLCIFSRRCQGKASSFSRSYLVEPWSYSCKVWRKKSGWLFKDWCGRMVLVLVLAQDSNAQIFPQGEMGISCCVMTASGWRARASLQSM